MTVETIPQAFRYICDICGHVHIQENATGHYTDSKPPHWYKLRILADADDWQGQVVAGHDIERLLCSTCGPIITAALNKATEAIRDQTPKGEPK